MKSLLHSIEIQNFKCFGSNPPALIHCAPITLLYGPNSAGKSTVTQALRLMQAQFSNESPGHNPFNFKNWKVGFDWMAPYDLMRHRHAKDDEPLTLTCRFPRTGDLQSSDNTVAFVRLCYASSNGVLERIEFGYADVVRFTLAVGGVGPTSGAPKVGSNAAIIECLTTGDHVGSPTNWKVDKQYEKELKSWGWRLQKFFREELRHLGPQRVAPLRTYKPRLATSSGSTSLDKLSPEAFASASDGELVMADDGRGYADWLFQHEDSLAGVNMWLQRLGVGAIVELQKADDGYRVLLKPEGSNNRIGLPDVGFGVSQILPIIVYAVAEKGKTIIIEQPELHIHPKLQAELGNLFVESVKERGNQFVIETHSEHLFLRMQRLIRRGTINPDDISATTVSMVSPGVSAVKRVSLNEDGEFLDLWPNGFFPERLMESIRS